LAVLLEALLEHSPAVTVATHLAVLLEALLEHSQALTVATHSAPLRMGSETCLVALAPTLLPAPLEVLQEVLLKLPLLVQMAAQAV
jgi:hypothetical protein